MSIIQPRSLHSRDEKLRSVSVGTGVGHRQYSRASVLQGEVLIGELRPVNGLAASAIVVGEVAPLAHKIRDDAVESGALIAEALFPRAQGAEIFRCFRYDIATKLKKKTCFIISARGPEQTTNCFYDVCSGKRMFFSYSIVYFRFHIYDS